MGLQRDPHLARSYHLEVLLHLTAAEVAQEIVPAGLMLIVPEVRHKLPCKYLEGGRLPYPVPADEAHNLPLPHRRDMEEPEGIDAVLVDLVALELLAQVQDVDGVEWADLDADPATYAEPLGDHGQLVLPKDDALLAVDVDRTLLDALEAALLALTQILIDYCDSVNQRCHLVL